MAASCAQRSAPTRRRRETAPPQPPLKKLRRRGAGVLPVSAAGRRPGCEWACVGPTSKSAPFQPCRPSVRASRQQADASGPPSCALLQRAEDPAPQEPLPEARRASWCPPTQAAKQGLSVLLGPGESRRSAVLTAHVAPHARPRRVLKHRRRFSHVWSLNVGKSGGWGSRCFGFRLKRERVFLSGSGAFPQGPQSFDLVGTPLPM